MTAVSDRDQAIKHILHSAFSHAGQKCSATSLVLLQDEVYDDASFRRGLCEAVTSLKVGSAWELDTKMGPMIKPPSGDLETALKVLEPGEEWAVMPQPVEGNPSMWTPGVKYGVQPGSYTHMTEFFGPVLAVMRFSKLSEAVALVNQTGYGLTSGLESLDEREWDYWKAHLRAGNLYINRVTTGAIVLRQPFGGMGKSSFGAGMKAGGPNYVAQLMDFTDVAATAAAEKVQTPTLAALCSRLADSGQLDDARIVAAAASYERAMREEFSREHDHFLLIGQDNVRRYLPVGTVRVRVHESDTAFDLFARACAAHVARCRVVISVPRGLQSPTVQRLEQLTESWAGAIEFVEETDAELAQAIRDGQADRVRYAAADRAPAEVLEAANVMNGCLVRVPVSASGWASPPGSAASSPPSPFRRRMLAMRRRAVPTAESSSWCPRRLAPVLRARCPGTDWRREHARVSRRRSADRRFAGHRVSAGRAEVVAAIAVRVIRAHGKAHRAARAGAGAVTRTNSTRIRAHLVALEHEPRRLLPASGCCRVHVRAHAAAHGRRRRARACYRRLHDGLA